MRNIIDVNGTEVCKGDMVAPITGDFKGRVCDVKCEDGIGFVCIRASHKPYSRGVWYASDHVQRLAAGRDRAKKPSGNGAAAPAVLKPRPLAR